MSFIFFYLKTLYYFYLKIKSKIDLLKFQVKWRNLNRNNYTSAGMIFPLKCVKVGYRSYGELNVYSYSNGKNEKLTVGDYVSIANNVSFVLGGNHNINTFTTYPLKTFVLNIPYEDAFSKGAINICNEVWIGFGATILSGVTIGKGAIIAAGSLVVKDVPPYSIFGGNPANLIKYRFNQEVIDDLLKMDLLNFKEDFIKDNIERFYTKIDSINDVEFFLNNKN